ncbi:DUF2637 domain-containing protein [Streptomyces goshikiensis]|uniref:DUF2637 domain-containing protein n=1 Tax=Streptomyces goshikiensis TaxID=1942 RepID=UPI00365FCA7D
MIPLAVIAVLAGLTAAGVGFALSYGALRDAAVAWGFTGWQSYAFPLGVDGLIIALYTADLVLAWRQMARPWVRITAHALTAVTIALNVSAAVDGMPGEPTLSQALEQDFGRLLGHAMMPIAYVILTEVARWAIARTARIEAGLLADQALTLAEWALNFRVTWKIFKHAKTHPATYADARTFARELAIYRVWQKERALYATGTAEDRASVLDRMPALLAPYGVSVDDARAIPAQRLEQEEAQEAERRRADQQRQREREQAELADQRERERQEREDAHQTRMDALGKEAEETRQKGELAELKATVDGQSRAAAHRAEAAVATAEIQATTATTAAQRAAEEATRRAAAEEAAEESAKVATERAKTRAANAKLAEESAKVAEAERQEREAKRRVAEELAKEQAALAKVAEESAKVTAAERQIAEDQAKTAQAREYTAQVLLRAKTAEDLAGYNQRQRRVRTVARMLLGSVPAEEIFNQPAEYVAKQLKAVSPITNAEIGVAIGIKSPGTCSEHKTEALDLIARGYDPNTGYDPDAPTQTEA